MLWYDSNFVLCMFVKREQERKYENRDSGMCEYHEVPLFYSPANPHYDVSTRNFLEEVTCVSVRVS